MNPLQGLDIKVVGKWPTLPKNFNQKENTMKYMTNKMMQRFMSHMSSQLAYIQEQRERTELEIDFCKENYEKFKEEIKDWKVTREKLRKDWLKYEYYQRVVKTTYRERCWLFHRHLQFMERVVTEWIHDSNFWIGHNYENFMCYRGTEEGKYWYNQLQTSKRKLAKLVELQQAIRKQKSITKD